MNRGEHYIQLFDLLQEATLSKSIRREKSIEGSRFNIWYIAYLTTAPANQMQNGTIRWKKIGMPDRKRMYSTAVTGKSGCRTTIGIKPVCFRWQRNKTPFLLVLEIPKRKILFVARTAGYRLLEKTLLAAKGFVFDRAGTENMILLLDRVYGGSEKENPNPVDPFSFSKDSFLLDRLWKLIQQRQISWKLTSNGDFAANILSSTLTINRYWVESTNQIGVDPLVLELSIPGRSLFTFWGAECGSYLSDILSFTWDHGYLTENELHKNLEKTRRALTPNSDRDEALL